MTLTRYLSGENGTKTVCETLNLSKLTSRLLNKLSGTFFQLNTCSEGKRLFCIDGVKKGHKQLSWKYVRYQRIRTVQESKAHNPVK